MGGFEPHPDGKKRLESVKRAIRAILDIRDELRPEHVRAFLNRGLSLLTVAEAKGKYRIRYWTHGALRAKLKKDLRHEHVVEKKKLVDRLLKNPEMVDDILESAVACVVTKCEHSLLTQTSHQNPQLDGWDRYKAAGLMASVVDGRIQPLIEAAKQLSMEELSRLVEQLEKMEGLITRDQNPLYPAKSTP
jgi:hypothetical protein